MSATKVVAAKDSSRRVTETVAGAPARARPRWQRALLGVAGAGLALWSLWPVAWTVLISFKPDEYIFRTPPSVRFPATLSHYQRVLNTVQFGHYLQTSLVVAGLTATLALVLGVPAAYSIARFRTGGEGFAMWILSARLLPPIAFIIPFYVWFARLGLLDTRTALVLSYLIPALPLSVWVLRGFIADLPAEIEEAALLDGCNRWQVLRRIVVPLTGPALAATFFLTFVAAWNEFLFALVLSFLRAKTWTVGALTFVGHERVLWGELAAAGTLGMAPTIGLLFFAQRYLVRGLSLGLWR